MKPIDVLFAVAVASGKASVRELRGPRRLKRLTIPRAVAVYVLRERLGLTWAEVSKVMGGRDRSTLIHAYRKGREAGVSPELQRLLENGSEAILPADPQELLVRLRRTVVELESIVAATSYRPVKEEG